MSKFSISPAAFFFYSLRSKGRRPERSEVNKFVLPREISRASSSEKYIYIHIIHITDWKFTLLLSVCESENPFWEKAIKRLSPPKRPLCARTRRLGRGERKRARENGEGKENTPSAPPRSLFFFLFPFGIPLGTHAEERDQTESFVSDRSLNLTVCIFRTSETIHSVKLIWALARRKFTQFWFGAERAMMGIKQ